MSLPRHDLSDLTAFLAIARHLSFRRAAAELGVSTSALSHRLRQLEERLGVRLLNRTSRSVVPTEAGYALMRKLETGFRQIGEALEDINRFRAQPTGRIRLNVPRAASELLLGPILTRFMNSYPDLQVEVKVEDTLVDIVAGGFDAGIRFGGSIPKDMVAVRLSPDYRWIVVGAPEYLRAHGLPRSPADLRDHRCIQLRCGNGALYRWEFECGDCVQTVEVPGRLCVNDPELALRAALDGAGLAYCLEPRVAGYLATGRLREVLADWCPDAPGLYLYYPGHRQVPAGLRALVRMVREETALTRQPAPLELESGAGSYLPVSIR